MDERDRVFFESVVDAYHKSGESIRETATVMELSRSKVRKILITMGEITSEITEAAVPLLAEGKSQQEVAEILGVSVATLSTYLPYGNRVFGRKEKSDDAIRSEQYRARQVKAAQGQVNKKDDSYDPESGETSCDAVKGCKDTEDVVDQENNIYISGGAEMNTVPYLPYLDKDIKVLRLKLELETDEDDLEVLRKYGKVKEGITREFIVPFFYPLHALHYAIQKAFGWQNSHLHHFELTEEDFDKITEDSFMKYCKLCGLYFRFPHGEDMDDIYWDDDYTEGKSFKTWLKSKYTSPYRYGGIKEHYMFSQVDAKRFWDENRTVSVYPPFAEFIKGNNEPREVAVVDATCEEMRSVLEGDFGELIERATISNIMGLDNALESKNGVEAKNGTMVEISQTADELEAQFEVEYNELVRLLGLMKKWEKAKKKEERISRRKNSPAINKLFAMTEAQNLEKEYEEGMQRLINRTSVEMPPVCKELIYRYDYGDGWSVRITCVDEYVCAFKGEKFDKFYNSNGEPLEEGFGELIFKNCIADGNPICVAADGLPVMDDVGGVSGYCDFLKCTKTGEEEGMYDDPESSKEWARGMGWTGRMSKPENIL